MPSIVPFVTDGQRAQPTDVAVSMDGEVLTTRIDGRSVEVDPGLHEIVFSMAGREIYRESILILEGQRNRLITVNLSDQATPPPLTATPQAPELAVPATSPEAAETTTTTGRDSAPSASVVPFVVGGVGVAAIGGSLLMAHWASDDNRELDLCAPNCSQESVDHVRNMYIAADITLGAGVVALGAATWLYFSSADRERPNDTAAYHVDVHPVARGAMATMAAEF